MIALPATILKKPIAIELLDLLSDNYAIIKLQGSSYKLCSPPFYS